MNFDLENRKSLNGNLWKIVPADECETEYVAQRFSLPPLLAKILVSRGIFGDEVSGFLDAKLQNLMPDPYCLKDMQKAAERIAEAVAKRQTVGIIGDYDVDGATSSSLLRLFLESLGCRVLVRIPERDEGYGPNMDMIAEFAKNNAELIVSVDCGTAATAVFTEAKSYNIDTIVLDHHEAETILPPVYAVVNPKRLDQDDTHPALKYLAAVGVVFLAIVAVNRCLRNLHFYAERKEPNLMQWLDIVALGTVCDVVPLLGLNRAFVRQGLKVMARQQNFGIKALLDSAAVSEPPSSYHLGYALGPRINAGGRVGDSSFGHRLLCCHDNAAAAELAEKLNSYNDQRKEIEAYVLLRAIEILEGRPQKYPIAFVYGQDWHQGVIGIVAGKLKERYNLPSFVMSIEADEVKGSARSIPGLNLGALIIAAKEKGLLTKGGGHMMAAGFSLKAENIEAFYEFAGQYVQKYLGEEQLTPVLEIDGFVDAAAVNLELAEKLAMLEPYGAGNPEPRLLLPQVKVSYGGIVGSGHVRCNLSSLSGGAVKAIAFRVADTEMGKALLSARGDVFNIVGSLRINNWQGRSSAQFIIEDAMRA